MKKNRYLINFSIDEILIFFRGHYSWGVGAWAYQESECQKQNSYQIRFEFVKMDSRFDNFIGVPEEPFTLDITTLSDNIVFLEFMFENCPACQRLFEDILEKFKLNGISYNEIPDKLLFDSFQNDRSIVCIKDFEETLEDFSKDIIGFLSTHQDNLEEDYIRIKLEVVELSDDHIIIGGIQFKKYNGDLTSLNNHDKSRIVSFHKTQGSFSRGLLICEYYSWEPCSQYFKEIHSWIKSKYSQKTQPIIGQEKKLEESILKKDKNRKLGPRNDTLERILIFLREAFDEGKAFGVAADLAGIALNTAKNNLNQALDYASEVDRERWVRKIKTSSWKDL
ncbi:MAG: hypothetical protein JEZ06_11815 [Anaerolineaceae bacterium]|nr:hypothetical protein [Anaerolineaceae bacterium]